MALLLRVLMLFLLSGGSARVVTNFEECGKFFANGKSPTTFTGLPQYKQICQTLNGVVHYATYYDTYNRTPVYSAYRFEGIKGCKRQPNWYIEPQLDLKQEEDMASKASVDRNPYELLQAILQQQLDKAGEDMASGVSEDRNLYGLLQAIMQQQLDDKAGEDMASEASVKDINLRGVHQALNGDYVDSGYHKGHLAPVYQAESQSCAHATFTLTNAAPQEPRFNSVLWWNVEKNMAKFLESQCRSIFLPVYIVTGVVPGPGNINNRVNVPSHFWTAYCCLDQNNRCSISGGVIGTNEKNSSIIRDMSVADLERELQNLYGTTFRLFQY